MDPFFKAPYGKMFEYEEKKRKCVYRQRFYTEEQKDMVDADARQFMFTSNEDFHKARRTAQGMKRVMTQVKYNLYEYGMG